MPDKKFNEDQLTVQVRTLIGNCCLNHCSTRIKNAIKEIISIINEQKKGLLNSPKNADNITVLLSNEQQIDNLAQLIWREIKNYDFYLNEYPPASSETITIDSLIKNATQDPVLRQALYYILQKHSH